MAPIGEYLDRMVISVSSPDRNITARISNYHDVEVAFAPGAYRGYTEDGLSHQLARLGAIAFVGYQRGRSEAYRRALDLSQEEAAATERLRGGGRQQSYEDALNRVEGVGTAAGGTLRVRTVGMLNWSVQIEPGTLRRLTEGEFLGEVHSAFTALMANREMQIIMLKSEYFDLGLPKQWLEKMRRARAFGRR